MNNFFRALIAGWGAKKLGGGCFSTIIIFIIIYTVLGKCGNNNSRGATLPASTKTEAVHVYKPGGGSHVQHYHVPSSR